MNKNIKLFITLVLCIGVVLSVIFDEVLLNILLMGMLLAKKSIFKLILVAKKFFFKEGIVSLATVAWKHVFVSSSLALSKRAIINTISGFFNERIAKPLIHPISRYLKIRWSIFKASNLWQKTYTIIFGSIPASIVLWFFGVVEAITLLLKSFSLAKFLTLILKLMMMMFVFFHNIWRSWIQPYLDFILITILLTYIEKIPLLGRGIRRIRITIRWKWRKIKAKKERILNQHIDANINKVGEKIHQHVNTQKEKMSAKIHDLSETVEDMVEKVEEVVTPEKDKGPD